MKPLSLAAVGALLLATPLAGQTYWRSLEIRDKLTTEDCNGESYQKSEHDYAYGQYVEDLIVVNLGGVWSPYTGEIFESTKETDIEHIVARSEAHWSGLCFADRRTRRLFSSDLLNLTLADPTTNRQEKSYHDAAGWAPEINQCWFAEAVLAVKTKYDLSVDCKEARTLESMLNDKCGYERMRPRCSP